MATIAPFGRLNFCKRVWNNNEKIKSLYIDIVITVYENNNVSRHYYLGDGKSKGEAGRILS